MGNIVLKEDSSDRGEIVVYQPDEVTRIEVQVEGETVWLTQAQMSILFQKDQSVIARHIKNVFTEGELEEMSNMQILHNTLSKYRPVKVYTLDVIISVGYRVKSFRGTQFRRWATNVLKETMLRGHSFNQRLTCFDAYVFATDLIRSARQSVILIDNYVDESVLLMLAKRHDGVLAEIHTGRLTESLKQDLTKHNSQYPPIMLTEKKNIHDRFLIVDEDIYHIGASMKDLGKKLFAFSKLSLSKAILIK